jgi:hypothetical protein
MKNSNVIFERIAGFRWEKIEENCCQAVQLVKQLIKRPKRRNFSHQ